ncbi:hypothetical protein Rhopal_000254-T1 [Rhodotorula paludigena]|uniref:Proteophosphoglycan ppg4 n=1 Tax=Rhodotorula paludigena TaxID=86838 RepID=A0AAV5G4G0_9BASI|nr:hypothetical protein Rhopal_000254-T1 [Rhodotorula paludigena]
MASPAAADAVEDPAAVQEAGAPPYTGAALHSDVRIDAETGIPSIGTRTALPPEPMTASFRLERIAMFTQGGKECAEDCTADSYYDLVVSDEGLSVTAAPAREKAFSAKLALAIDRFEVEEGSTVCFCVAVAAPGHPDTVLLFHIDTKHVSGFDPAQLELAKALVRPWQQRYPELKADIPTTRALAIPPPGISLAYRAPVPPGYNPRDPSTWVAPFLREPATVRVTADHTGAASTSASGAPAGSPSRPSKRTRKSSSAPLDPVVKAESPHPEVAIDPALLAYEAAFASGEPVYSETGRQKRRATLKKPAVLEAVGEPSTEEEADKARKGKKKAAAASAAASAGSRKRRSGAAAARSAETHNAASTSDAIPAATSLNFAASALVDVPSVASVPPNPAPYASTSSSSSASYTQSTPSTYHVSQRAHPLPSNYSSSPFAPHPFSTFRTPSAHPFDPYPAATAGSPAPSIEDLVRLGQYAAKLGDVCTALHAQVGALRGEMDALKLRVGVDDGGASEQEEGGAVEASGMRTRGKARGKSGSTSAQQTSLVERLAECERLLGVGAALAPPAAAPGGRSEGGGFEAMPAGERAQFVQRVEAFMYAFQRAQPQGAESGSAAG